MASNVTPSTRCQKQHKTLNSQIMVAGACKHSQSHSNTLDAAPSEVVQESMPQKVPNNAARDVLQRPKQNHQRKKSVAPAPNKIRSKTRSHSEANNLAPSLGTQKLPIQEFNLVEKLQNNDTQVAKVNKYLNNIASEKSSAIKESATFAQVSDMAGNLTKTGDSAKISVHAEFVQRGKSSICSTGSDASNGSTCSSINSGVNKPHKANDSRWEATQAVRSKDGILGLNHFRLLKRLGCGDIGTVYLSKLSGTSCYFAMKVMDKQSLASRKKLLRAKTEREILQCLDHPFLPTLYTHFETDKFSCLVMEFCPGGDLHTLRQRQPGKYFTEQAVKFYAAEVLLAIEYLHMLGIIYRDLKPENVLVRDDGHIMLSDFDLSLRCAVRPTLVGSSNPVSQPSSSSSSPSSSHRDKSGSTAQPACIGPSCVRPPSCVTASTTCFSPHLFSGSKREPKHKAEVGTGSRVRVGPWPELIAEPTDARSMSFVGTHEYLAPEIIKGEGHGSAVDWWTMGIFLYELLFGRTPFRGAGNRATLFNVVGQPLGFPESPAVSLAARDLTRGLLAKEPRRRLACRRGAAEIKQHPFFQGVNWALIRCASPPEVPKPVETEELPPAPAPPSEEKPGAVGVDREGSDDDYLEFDFF